MKKLLLLFYLVPAFLSAQNGGIGVKRPNIVILLSDDQGWGDLSLSGNTNINTPNIDAIAQKGAVFEHFYVQPVCSPTRAELLTGRYHTRMGVRSTSEGGERFNLDETTLAMFSRKRATPRRPMASGIAGCSIPTIPMAGASMISTDFVAGIGAIISAQC